MSAAHTQAEAQIDPLRAGGILLSAYILWGLSPIYFKLAAFASPLEIVLHRALWSAPVLVVLLLIAGNLRTALSVARDWRKLGLLAISGAIIGSNWLIFIWAINSGRVLDVSLGYFINPLMNVAVGVFVASERFSRLRAIAVGLAALGVINQMIQLGEIPYIGLYLAVSFTLYGYIRKRIAVDAQTGVFWETALIFLPSIILLAIFSGHASEHFTSFFDGAYEMAILLGTGIVTVTPLVLWATGARRLSFAVIGVVQFVAPSLQFAVGLLYGEAFNIAHAITFGLIWLGLAVFVTDLILHERKASQQAQES
jgi:chloramphenicol-sensitive protein RarD